MKEIDLWLQNNLQYEDLRQCLSKAILFYGKCMTDAIQQYDLDLFLNDKRNRRKLGDFSPNSISLYDTRKNIHEILDCVFVHELAHFLDCIRTIEESRYKNASSIPGSKERVLAELFRNNMNPVPENRRRYRGRTCECFARTMEEFYAIKTNNRYWIDEYKDFDYYVDIEMFKKSIYPTVEEYLKRL